MKPYWKFISDLIEENHKDIDRQRENNISQTTDKKLRDFAIKHGYSYDKVVNEFKENEIFLGLFAKMTKSSSRVKGISKLSRRIKKIWVYR